MDEVEPVRAKYRRFHAMSDRDYRDLTPHDLMLDAHLNECQDCRQALHDFDPVMYPQTWVEQGDGSGP
jgi:hypothetical protein